MPQVTVLMSVYVRIDPGYLEKAIASILAQTFDDFEFTIIADGRLTSCQQETLKRYAAADTRLTILQNDQRRGLSYSMNLGISLSKSDYVARMDADDVSLPERLEKQIALLEDHKDIEIVGTFVYEIDDADRIVFRKRLPVGPADLALFLAKRDPFVHPTVVFRRNVFGKVGLYNQELRTNQDTDLWCRSFIAGARGANIPEFLYLFRRDKDFFDRRRGYRYAFNVLKLRCGYIRRIGLSFRYYTFPLLEFPVRVAPEFVTRAMFAVAR